jgi:ParB family chromosome partitioning protein
MRPREYPSNSDRQRAYRQRKRNAQAEAAALRNSSDEWFTSAPVIDLARQVLGGIDLDPASCEFAQRTVQAARWFGKVDNGLVQPWQGRVWLNPPYSHPLVERFTTKLISEYDEGSVETAICLVNNATDTAWFQRLLTRFPACFTKGRIRFRRIDRTPVSPRLGQVLFYLGREVDRFALVFSGIGRVLRACSSEVDALRAEHEAARRA